MGLVARGIKGETGGLELSVPSPDLRGGKTGRRLNGQGLNGSFCDDASIKTKEGRGLEKGTATLVHEISRG